ncbi:MAG: CAP domain-containing protein [Proteobacteria bacterium]|nr:CAP domain-containing protein [Pseudomonadota bacterium]
MCERWNADRADLSEGAWSGSLDTCDAGDITESARESALRLVNLYRWLCGLPAVTDDATKNAGAQECALMMHANGTLNHYPPTSWTCYSDAGASTAGQSNIATAAAVGAVDLYMVDPGNPTTIGHRRWILSNSLGPIGIGSTSGYSCMHVLYGSGSAGASWTAWPPSGQVPIAAFTPSWSSVDDTGWTVQSDSISLSSADVTVTLGGDDKPVTVTHLLEGYGSSSAISFIPSGWSTAAGNTYHVTLSGVSSPIEYDVEVIDCP